MKIADILQTKNVVLLKHKQPGCVEPGPQIRLQKSLKISDAIQTRLCELTKSSEQESELKFPGAIQIQKLLKKLQYASKKNFTNYYTVYFQKRINSLFLSKIFQITQLKHNIFQ